MFPGKGESSYSVFFRRPYTHAIQAFSIWNGKSRRLTRFPEGTEENLKDIDNFDFFFNYD